MHLVAHPTIQFADHPDLPVQLHHRRPALGRGDRRAEDHDVPVADVRGHRVAIHPQGEGVGIPGLQRRSGHKLRRLQLAPPGKRDDLHRLRLGLHPADRGRRTHTRPRRPGVPPHQLPSIVTPAPSAASAQNCATPAAVRPRIGTQPSLAGSSNSPGAPRVALATAPPLPSLPRRRGRHQSPPGCPETPPLAPRRRALSARSLATRWTTGCSAAASRPGLVLPVSSQYRSTPVLSAILTSTSAGGTLDRS